jgi:hypothetical protein
VERLRPAIEVVELQGGLAARVAAQAAAAAGFGDQLALHPAAVFSYLLRPAPGAPVAPTLFEDVDRLPVANAREA